MKRTKVKMTKVNDKHCIFCRTKASGECGWFEDEYFCNCEGSHTYDRLINERLAIQMEIDLLIRDSKKETMVQMELLNEQD